MKKLLFVLVCTIALFFSTSLGNQAHAEKSEGSETQIYVPISKMWYETLPVPYQGRTMFQQVQRHNQCLKGYLGARNVGGNYFVYEGYLYPCSGPIPIPTLKPIEEESE